MATTTQHSKPTNHKDTKEKSEKPDGKPGDQIDKNVPRDQDPEIGHAPKPETIDHEEQTKKLQDEDRERFLSQGDKG